MSQALTTVTSGQNAGQDNTGQRAVDGDLDQQSNTLFRRQKCLYFLPSDAVHGAFLL